MRAGHGSESGGRVANERGRWKRIGRAVSDAIAPFVELLDGMGTTVSLTAQTLLWIFRRPVRPGLIVSSMEFVGVQSIFIVGLTGTFSGMVLALQMVNILRRFQADAMVGGIVVVALLRELAPVFTGLMVTARAGSAMAAELGNMRVTEQVDALTTMSVSAVQYLLSPRMVASILMMPLLFILYSVAGTIGAYFVAVSWLNVDPGLFFDKIRQFSAPDDLYMGLVKAAVFGFLISAISCRHGFYASGGAKGVGLATTRAVVQSAVAILISNYIITSWMS